jgi:hypothetical protein
MADQTEQEREAKAVELANQMRMAAVALADQRESKAVGLAEDREAAALALAEKRGREAAELESRIDDHDKHFTVVNGSIERTAKGLTALGKNVADLTKAFETNMAIMADRAEVAARSASKQLDTRTFVIGLVSAVAAVIVAVSYLHL